MRNKLIFVLIALLFSCLIFMQFSCSDSEAERKRLEEEQKKLIEQIYNRGVSDGITKLRNEISNAQKLALQKFQNLVIYMAIVSGLVVVLSPAISSYVNEYCSKMLHLSIEDKLNLSTVAYAAAIASLCIWSWQLTDTIFAANLILCAFSLIPFLFSLQPGIKENDKNKIKAGAAQTKNLLLIGVILCCVYNTISKGPYI